MLFHERLNFGRKYPCIIALVLHRGYQKMNGRLSYSEILLSTEMTIDFFGVVDYYKLKNLLSVEKHTRHFS